MSISTENKISLGETMFGYTYINIIMFTELKRYAREYRSCVMRNTAI